VEDRCQEVRGKINDIREEIGVWKCEWRIGVSGSVGDIEGSLAVDLEKVVGGK
jgi:hypothetical protein